MFTYYALLGNTPDLSRLELESVISGPVTLVSPTLARFSTDKDAQELGNMLGGTLKLISLSKITTQLALIDDLVELISNSSQKNVAITNLSGAVIEHDDIYNLKAKITETRPIRFLSLETDNHSLVALRKQHVAEFVIFEDEGELIIGQTRWIHDADDWTLRDRNKPYRDIKRGMLPPKVARIMANLALRGQTGLNFADPFCGTGTILAEAAIVGCMAVCGSDTNPDAVRGSESNLVWLKSKYGLSDLQYKTVLEDATHLDNVLQNVDAIATEPYMGPLMEMGHIPEFEKVKNIAKGLKKLYIGSLRSWHKLLSGKGRVVISIPSFVMGDRAIPTLQVDDYALLGYNNICSVAYGKPGATVIRNITILEKK